MTIKKRIKAYGMAGLVLGGLGVFYWAANPAVSPVGVSPVGVSPSSPGIASVERGKYLYYAAGCQGCHTRPKGGKPLAGGRVLKTPFGEFITPNITPDRKFGIGAWRDEDFIRALRFGVSPRGEHYFPVFPYTSYSGMTDRDMLDLKAYLFSLPGVAQANQAHSVSPPFGWRFTVAFWKLLYFGPGQFQDTPGQDAQWNRGAYLVRALGHCGECHTPRNVLGATQEHRELSGTKNGPEGGKIPNLTPDRETGLGKWLGGDVVTVLEMGMLPDGDFVGSVMAEVVDHGTSHLSHEDRQAIEVYLLSRPAIKSDWRDKK